MNHTHSYFAQDAVLDLHEILIIAIPNTRTSTCPTRTLTFPKPTFPLLNTQCCIFSPANGMVVMAGNLVGNTATYSCNSGFELVGAQTVTCQADRTWSDPPPTCEPIGMKSPLYCRMIIQGQLQTKWMNTALMTQNTK